MKPRSSADLCAAREASMPRFLGKRVHPLYWDAIALVVLALLVLLVLELTGTTHLFGSVPGPGLA
jgi:hypothetical protein